MTTNLHERIATKAVQEKKEGDRVVLAGWAAQVKSLGKIGFLTIRDRTGTVQITVPGDHKQLSDLNNITTESVLAVTGTVQPSKLKSGGNEVLLDHYEIITLSDANLPIDVSGKTPAGLDVRLDNRLLDLRHPRALAIFKIRSRVNMAIREFLIADGCIEMQTPKVISAGAEGGATLFPVEYYDRKAYLSQSQQLYKQMMIAAGFEKVFEIGPSFRAEKSHTMRHLTEFTHFDFEMAFINDEDDVLKVIERMFVYVMHEVAKHCAHEIAVLGITLEVPTLPFPRVTYTECVEMLNKHGSEMKFGEDVGSEDERKLGKLVQEKYHNCAYFLTKWPSKVRAFYIMHEHKGELCHGFDFMYRGLELSSGGQREHRVDVLRQQIADNGMNPDNFEFYLQAFKYGMPTHGGFGIGVDRMVQMICQLDNIRDAVLFPRDPERLVP